MDTTSTRSLWRRILPLAILVALGTGVVIRTRLDRQSVPGPDHPLVHAFMLANVIPAEIKIYSPVASPDTLFKRCEEEVERCVDIFSNYRDSSEISQINKRAAGGGVEVSADMATVLAASLLANRQTDGAFDVTVMPLVHLWKAAGEVGVAPSREQLAAAEAKVGMASVVFDPESRQVRFLKPGVEMDLGGISKGYIIDRVVALLQAAGVSRGLVNIGGDLRVFGGTGEHPFSVGVQHPLRRGELAGVVRVEEGAVATSGDYEQFVVIDGKHYSHIVDPRRGTPVAWSPSVTVLAADAMTADWLATGISVLGAGQAATVAARQPGAECLVIHRSGAGTFEAVCSAGMVPLLHLEEDAGVAFANDPDVPPGDSDQ